MQIVAKTRLIALSDVIFDKKQREKQKAHVDNKEKMIPISAVLIKITTQSR